MLAIRIITSIAAAVIFNAVVFGTWGVTHASDLFDHPARCIALVLLTIRALQLPWSTQPAPRTKAAPGKQVRERWFFPPLLAGAALSLASPFFDRRGLLPIPMDDALRYPGLALFAAGLFLATWAQHHMGRWFSGHLIIQQGHRLLKDGPFAIVRHPRYTGLMLVFLGWPMVFSSLPGLIGGLICAVMFMLRIPKEEALLAREFQEEWAEYARKTKRVLPGIY
jgi:protein-S-isoprenylcysteine O-methyltransferase Ste14